MAWIFDGKHFGGYTYEHWFDDDPTPGVGEDSGPQTPAEESGGAEGGPSPQEPADTGCRH
ncbi:MAG: hypothetical protein LBQ88_00030 [Treponema sp.]|jgi:hypothetical protein|nr:hypothetical protein [Treponema sp.]